jgi:FRG domain
LAVLKTRPRSLERIKLRKRAQELFAQYIQWAASHPHPSWVFRGQREKWPLRPTIGRGTSVYSIVREAQLLDEFKRHARQYLPNSHSLSEWDWIFIAQHHGLPTRLVDWSTNPLVACFFACELSAHGKKHGEVTAISPREVGYLTSDEFAAGPLSISVTKFVSPTAVASRIISQRGLFSVHSNPTVAWQARGKREFFQIPAELKKEVKLLLMSMGVDSQFLMADLDGLTSTLKWRYDNGVASQ